MFSSGFRRERVFLFCCAILGASCLPGKINFYTGVCGLICFVFKRKIKLIMKGKVVVKIS